ncbi:Hypothetical_protein [Hexamita inflata]|uniref:Hypothetical_protein n=1 Tax=Hexamita inflata TaxID=28002 RepID=A0AA86QNJ9_9EUKA|nr:Hypothetical protein HINF_LOCUS50601 [Hexamita inflata]
MITQKPTTVNDNKQYLNHTQLIYSQIFQLQDNNGARNSDSLFITEQATVNTLKSISIFIINQIINAIFKNINAALIAQIFAKNIAEQKNNPTILVNNKLQNRQNTRFAEITFLLQRNAYIYQPYQQTLKQEKQQHDSQTGNFIKHCIMPEIKYNDIAIQSILNEDG